MIVLLLLWQKHITITKESVGQNEEVGLQQTRKKICSRTLTFRIFSNSMMSFFWYAAIKFVIARISGSFLYLQAFKEFQRGMNIKIQYGTGCQRSHGLASCPSKGFTSDSINILARTRYLMRSKNKL